MAPLTARDTYGYGKMIFYVAKKCLVCVFCIANEKRNAKYNEPFPNIIKHTS